ncbi:hypothetical protein HDU96_010626 [Phlyctochytrium bullatum]|nr:hypothetical protein HDU96_010626 [Phlyctochytrium bullatum]
MDSIDHHDHDHDHDDDGWRQHTTSPFEEFSDYHQGQGGGGGYHPQAYPITPPRTPSRPHRSLSTATAADEDADLIVPVSSLPPWNNHHHPVSPSSSNATLFFTDAFPDSTARKDDMMALALAFSPNTPTRHHWPDPFDDAEFDDDSEETTELLMRPVLSSKHRNDDEDEVLCWDDDAAASEGLRRRIKARGAWKNQLTCVVVGVAVVFVLMAGLGAWASFSVHSSSPSLQTTTSPQTTPSEQSEPSNPPFKPWLPSYNGHQQPITDDLPNDVTLPPSDSSQSWISTLLTDMLQKRWLPDLIPGAAAEPLLQRRDEDSPVPVAAAPGMKRKVDAGSPKADPPPPPYVPNLQFGLQLDVHAEVVKLKPGGNAAAAAKHGHHVKHLADGSKVLVNPAFAPAASPLVVGSGAEFTPIPKQIWTFWDSDDAELPWMIKGMTKGWQFFNPDYKITVLRPATVATHLRTPFPPHFWTDDTTRQQRANWIRLAVLMEKGGFWIDASTVLTGSLDGILERQKVKNTEAFAYHLDYFTLDKAIPVYETYFLATVPHGQWITAWFSEYNTVFTNFKCQDDYLVYLAKVYGDDGYQKIVQRINDPSYLKLTVASQRVLTHAGIDPMPDTETAESVPYRLLEASNYDDWDYARNLLCHPEERKLKPKDEEVEKEKARAKEEGREYDPEKVTPGVQEWTDEEILVYKMRGPTRQAIAELIESGTPVNPSSIFSKYVLRFFWMEME